LSKIELDSDSNKEKSDEEKHSESEGDKPRKTMMTSTKKKKEDVLVRRRKICRKLLERIMEKGLDKEEAKKLTLSIEQWVQGVD
jgi:hypothetical protein